MMIDFSNMNYLTKEDCYSSVLMTLFLLSDNPKYSTISELVQILDKESFLRFIKYYAGQTIQIPKMEDMSKLLKTILMYKYYEIDKLDWHDAMIKSGFNSSDSYTASNSLRGLKQALGEYED